MIVDLWDLVELSYDGPSDGNPFVEVELGAAFTCGATTLEVDGFYDGAGIFRIRFMPTEEGVWTYRTASNRSELDGHEGAITCGPPAESAHGPVGVVDTFHFAHADGTPFAPIGTTAYAWTHQPPGVRSRTLDTLRDAPFNKLRMCVFPKSYVHNEAEPVGYPFPLVRAGSSSPGHPNLLARSDWVFDTDRFDPAFFRDLDECVRLLASLGIEADIILFHPYDRWGFADLSWDVDDRYLRYVIARLAAFRNVWWSLANEYDLVTTKTTEDWERFIGIVAHRDPYGHLRSIHNCFRFYDHSGALLTHVSAQHDDPRRSVLWRAKYGKPVVVDECGYEGDVPDPWGNLSAQEMLDRCWTAVAHGAYVTHGETYVGDHIWWSHGGTLRGESVERIGFLRGILEAAPSGLEPIATSSAYGLMFVGEREDFELATHLDLAALLAGDVTGDVGEASIRCPFPGVHRPHEYYLLYFGVRQPSVVVADVPDGETYVATVIDTWTMTMTTLPEPVTRGAMVPLPTRPYLALQLARQVTPPASLARVESPPAVIDTYEGTMSTERRTSGSPVDGRTVAELSLAEQASLGSGADFWTTEAVGFVPSILMTDGPHGVRRQEGSGDHLGIAASEPATCFPPAVSLAQTWDPELVRRVGAALGREAQAQGVHVLLGPGINIRRDPRCGRNFEYFSEDPFIAGALGAAYVHGLQGQGVGASVKHFAANNQEYDRMLVSADVDPRTLREIYLRAFQRVVSEADPWTVMAAYNRINGVPAAQNHWLLTEVLRGEWGYEGVVVSDWGAVGDRPAAVAAGLDLQMPGTGGASDEEVIAAVEEGRLDPAAVERAAERVAALAHMATAAHREDATFDADEHHALSRQAAGRGIVLLRNEGDLLPLDRSEPLAVIGAFAESLRYQGGGSSHVNPTRVDVPVEEIRARSDDVVHAPGFTLDGSGDATALRDEAVTAARSASVAVVFLGLSETRDSEGADRPDIELPSEQLEVLRAVVAAQPRTVVVLFHGGVVRLAPVVASAPAILDAALPGQAGGAAVADVLFGAVNPSGKLTETVPVRVEDAPAYLNFPGERSHVLYGEGLHVGYRWYDARNLDVTFPFGHGLSYTTFEYSQFTVRGDEAGIVASVTVTNTGPRAGREVVQLYVGLPGSEVTRPARQLAGFGIVDVTAGASSTIEIAIRRDELAYWDQRVERWVVEGGDYVVAAGASSRDLRLSATVRVDGDAVAPPVTLESALEDVMRHPVAGELLSDAIAPVVAGSSNDESRAELNMDVSEMVARMPLSRIASFSQGRITKPQLEALIAEVERRALYMHGGPGPAGI